jgi:site-specific DNA recombinase
LGEYIWYTCRMRQVIGYVRYSPGGHELDTQIRHVREKAADIQAELTQIYEEPGITGRKSGSRPVFDREVLPSIKPGLFGVVSPEMSRLTRNAEDALLLFNTCREAKVGIFLKRGVDLDLSTAGGLLVAEQLASIARFEVNLKDERTEGAEDTRIIKGNRRSAKRHAGYSANGKDINEWEAGLLRAGAAAVIKGDKWSKVAKEWNAAGFHTPRGVKKDLDGNAIGPGRGGNPWHSGSVQKVLTSPTLAALIKLPDGQYVNGIWPAIITEAEHHALVALVGGAVNRGPAAPNSSLLGGIAQCECGRPVRGGRNVQRVLVYNCPDGHLSLPRDPVDSYVESLYISDMGWSPGPTDTTVTESELANLRQESAALGEMLARKQVTLPQLAQWNAVNLPRIAELERALSEAATEDLTAWADLSLDQRRKRLREWNLGPIELHPVGRGRRNWNPAEHVYFLGT